MEKKKPENNVFEGIMAGTKQAIEHMKGERKLTVRRATMPEPPKPINAKNIVSLRQKLNVSQTVFASMLNVSSGTVQAWEHGRNRPNGSSLRLLQIIQRDPDLLRKIC